LGVYENGPVVNEYFAKGVWAHPQMPFILKKRAD
jgi:hypothetical protein